MVLAGCLGIRFAGDEGPGILVPGALIFSGIAIFFWLAVIENNRKTDR